MDALVDAVIKRGRPRDLGMFMILRYTGTRRESVATLKVKHLDRTGWLPGVLVKGGTTRDIPVPASIGAYLLTYTKEVLPKIAGQVTPETPLFWSKWGRRVVGRTIQPMTGKNLWRLSASTRRRSTRASAPHGSSARLFFDVKASRMLNVETKTALRG